MRVRIYQIDEKRDSNRVKFLWYEFTQVRAGRIDPSIYNVVFSGDVECDTLNGVFDLFNMPELPEDYRGHSLSVSDVIEVCERTEGPLEPGFYFCDTVGWRRLVDFDSTKTAPLQAN